MIPEEDRGPSWLRDYGNTDFGNIEADIAAMQEFATRLAADVRSNYAPHLTDVSDAMLTRLPVPDARFTELVSFIDAHRVAQGRTQQNVYNYANGTDNMARVAHEVSEQYRGADAFASARVADVQSAFDKVAESQKAAGGDA